MDNDKLIEHLKRRGLSNGSALGPHSGLYDDAALAIETLRAENAEMERQLNEFSEFLCHMTGGLLSKTNYTAHEMISAAEDYQQKVCGECDLRAENEKLREKLEAYRNGHCAEGGCAAEKDRDAVLADLARVTAERDAAVDELRGKRTQKE